MFGALLGMVFLYGPPVASGALWVSGRPWAAVIVFVAGVGLHVLFIALGVASASRAGKTNR